MQKYSFGGTCHPCPNEELCQIVPTFRRPNSTIAAGFYRESHSEHDHDNSTDHKYGKLFPCGWANASVCLPSACYLDLTTNTPVCNLTCDSDADINPCCAEGYNGRMCARCRCANDTCWFRGKSGCKMCSHQSSPWRIIVGVAVFLFIILIVFVDNPAIQFFTVGVEILIVILLMFTLIENEAWVGIIVILILVAVVCHVLKIEPSEYLNIYPF